MTIYNMKSVAHSDTSKSAVPLLTIMAHCVV